MLRRRWVKVLVWLLCLIPAGYLGWRGYHQDLSANPIEFITRYTGDWTLRFLVITLAITPLRRLLGLPDLIKFRRMIGLFAFFYGCLHFTTYIWLDKLLDLQTQYTLGEALVHLPRTMLVDVAKRPFITAGFTAFVLMIPLALTSTTGWIRRLGGKRWQLLHRLIYISAIAGVVHYYWLIKSAVQRPIFYGCLVLLALAIRAWYWARVGQSKILPRPEANPETTRATTRTGNPGTKKMEQAEQDHASPQPPLPTGRVLVAIAKFVQRRSGSGGKAPPGANGIG